MTIEELEELELSAFVASLQLGNECKPIDIKEAFYNMANWLRDGVELPKHISPLELMLEWNYQLTGEE